jgi:hypothetical protein
MIVFTLYNLMSLTGLDSRLVCPLCKISMDKRAYKSNLVYVLFLMVMDEQL